MQDISFEFAQREVRDRYNVSSRADLEALQASLARQRDKNVLKALGQALSAQADDTEYDNIANSTSAEELRAIVRCPMGQGIADQITPLATHRLKSRSHAFRNKLEAL